MESSKNCYLDGAIPISVGPRPLNNARTPSVCMICLGKQTTNILNVPSVKLKVGQLNIHSKHAVKI